MRTWVSLSACRRHSSLAATANVNGCGYRNGRPSASGYLDCRGNSHTLSRRRSRSRPIQIPSSFSQQLANSHSQRDFSSTPSTCIALEDDEDEPAPVAFHNGRNSKRPSKPSTTDLALRDILTSRASKSKRPPPPKYLDPKEVHEVRKIEKKAQILLAMPQFCQTYVDLKYASLEHLVFQYATDNRRLQQDYVQLVSAWVGVLETLTQQSSQRNKFLEHEYCIIKFRESAGLGKSIAHIEETIAGWRDEVFNMVIECSEAFTARISQMLEAEYLSPRQSARAEIDKFLHHGATIQQEYRELQEKGNAVRDGLSEILNLCNAWIAARCKGYLKFTKLVNAHRIVQQDYDTTVHLHRASWLKRRRSHMNFTPLMTDLMAQCVTQRRVVILSTAVVRAMMLGDKRRGTWKEIVNRRHAIASAIEAGYMKTWNGPKGVDDPFLNINWRQLDVIAPFELLLVFDWLLTNEIWYLAATLLERLGPMWDRLTPMQRQHHADTLREWVARFRHQQKDFLTEYDAYKQISSTRFEIEQKLHELGVYNEIRERGLFVALNPLSQDHAQFRLWVNRFCTIASDAWCLSKICRFAVGPAPREAWEDILKEYYAINNARRERLIQSFGSVRTRRRRGRAKPRLPYLRSPRKRKESVEAWPARKGWKHAAKSMRYQGSRPAEQQTAAGFHERSNQSVEAHRTSTVASTPSDGTRVRMKTAMGWRMRSVRSLSEPSRTSNPTMEVPESAQKPHLDRDSSTANDNLESAAQSAATGRKAVRTPSRIRRAGPLRRVHVRPSRMWYHSRVFRSTTPTGLDKPVLEQTPASSIPIIAESSECGSELASTIISPSQTIPSTFELKEKKVATPLFWNHNLHRGPDGRKLIVHYCQSLEGTEAIAQHFLKSKVIGFDMEWKAQASSLDSIQDNLSLIQLANEERIALFQIAKFRPARYLQDFVAPSLKRVLESPEITKVGVAIKADSTRLRKYLGIEARSIFELSHLFRLVKYGLTSPELVNKRSVNLSEQIEEHFGLPLDKDDDVRRGDWTRALSYRQVQYAATDPFASLCLYHVMEQKRQAMDPMPPRPAHVELNLPIVLPLGQTVNNEDKDPLVPDPVDVDAAARS